MIRNIIHKENKRAAMEMSVGTIVVIVLLMAVLVLGLALTRNIFKSATNSIDGIDAGVQNEIATLFSQDDQKKIVVYPGRSIKIKKGADETGFAFSIRNLDEEATFAYQINAIDSDCGINQGTANSYISLGAEGSGIQIPSANVMDNPIMVKFKIPENAPACEIRYQIVIGRNGATYASVDVDVKIIGR